MSLHGRFVLILIAGAIIGMAFVPPIPQDIHYHAFADRRTWLGIPNFLDVISNLPFVVVGLVGLAALRHGPLPGGLAELVTHYRIFFIGVLLTGFGSAYYHLEPNNTTLVWDRLPMTIAFMAFFAALVGESVSLKAGRRLLWPLLLIGILSVIYWHVSELLGRGDLRPYILVQFLPLVLTPYILLAFPSPFTRKHHLWWLVALYVLAKALELTDAFWFELTGIVSGHTLKHLAAALAGYCFYRALMVRTRRLA